MRLVWGIVVSILEDAEDIQRLEVALDDGSRGTAVAYPRMSGRCGVSDRILLNTTAVDMSLGTGGAHFVVANGRAADGVALDAPSGGHIMKVRYTPAQIDVLAVEEQDSPHHEVMRSADSLAGMPVACCGLHSHVPLVAAAIKHAAPDARVAYVMTDGAALPIALSDVVRASRAVGLLDATITCGHAFGGEFEAVNLHSGLLAARHVARADIAVVAIGPGVVGTATPFGHGGIAQGEALNAVTALGGLPVAVLRASGADQRVRHRGVSHHTLTALTRVALGRVIVPLPGLPEEIGESVEAALDEAGVWDKHTRVATRTGRAASPGLRGVEVRTMGRGVDDDPLFFACAFAAGEACVMVLHGEITEVDISSDRGGTRT